MRERAVLVSRSCTTGWADWIHGELWILPTALVRRRLGFAETQSNSSRPTVRNPLPEALPAEFPFAQVLSAHSTNKAIQFDQIARAGLRKGRLCDRLAVEMYDGSRHKLLWLSADPAYQMLNADLGEILGEGLARS